jgi:hypothetical protein
MLEVYSPCGDIESLQGSIPSMRRLGSKSSLGRFQEENPKSF